MDENQLAIILMEYDFRSGKLNSMDMSDNDVFKSYRKEAEKMMREGKREWSENLLSFIERW